ncbi:hypothetical protein IV203_002719 [Nitzschia inconspicua]|uniref:Sulfotransferase n=1 Tax=Nitzschia inconspicua TaxID=303405 RepID=A0A9K3L1C0_9STRA|nr:hypothetical protein IV203_002719 [Nitzschia inconspicua]
MVALAPSRLRSPPTGNNGKKMVNQKYKVSFMTMFLLALVAILSVQVIVLYSGVVSLDQSDSKRKNNGKYDFRDLARRINSNNGKSRIVQEYNDDEPLIPVEVRSKADPFPPSKPLILTSPFVKFVTPVDSKEQNLPSAKGKVVKATLSNGTVVRVGLADFFTELEQQKQTHRAFASALNLTIEGTYNVLKGMGVNPNEPPPKPKPNSYDNESDEESEDPPEPIINWTAQLPPWGQILENYGPEPIILGMDRCQAYRDSVPPEQRAIVPAGLFSTGTNLFFTLMLFNCLPPPVEDRDAPIDNPEAAGGRKYKYKQVTIPMRKKFVQWQAPWGSSAVFPVVLTRHPYTWLHTMCKHSYSARWAHDRELCEHQKNLGSMASVRFGSNPKVDGKQQRTKYANVVEMYKDWYLSFFDNTEYPMAIARFEDVVYRPESVVRQMCECVGGRMLKKFSYRQETVNMGPGHGHHGNSGLLPSFVKYGKNLKEYYEMFSKGDKKILKYVFQNEEGFLEALGYKTFEG